VGGGGRIFWEKCIGVVSFEKGRAGGKAGGN